MQKLEFNVSTEIELIKAIINELPFLSRYDVKKILENHSELGLGDELKRSVNRGQKIVIV